MGTNLKKLGEAELEAFCRVFRALRAGEAQDPGTVCLPESVQGIAGQKRLRNLRKALTCFKAMRTRTFRRRR